MSEAATIARPYARAAFEHARAQRALPAWSALLAAGAAVAASETAEALFGNPRVSAGALVELIAGVAHDSGVAVGAAERNFIAILAHNRRLALLPEIAAQYATLRAEAEQTLTVEVVTAMALSREQRARLGAALKQRFHREIELAERLDPGLVGGAIVRAGDLVIDGSLQGRLTRLEQQLAQP